MGWERIAWQVTKAITLIKKVMTNPDARVVVVRGCDALRTSSIAT